MWYEVESKIKINDYRKVREVVRKIASFKSKETKKDEYFALHDEGYPRKSFRIRDNGQNYVVNFKKKMDNLSDKEIVVKEEYEFAIKSRDEVSNFLSLCKDLGFKEWVGKNKKSESYSYKKNRKVTIELNDVAKLGRWMEIEYLCPKNEIKKAKKIINDVLSIIYESGGLGQIDNTGYTKMLFNLRNK